MNRRHFLEASGSALASLALPQWLTAAVTGGVQSQPNIIFILADDLGIGNVGCYGADNFKTPHLDALAESGTRFEHCYSSPLCGPSRALIMTGRYAFRTGMTSNQTGDLLKPANETMMPKVLKTAGYVSGMCGKWAQLPLQPSDWGFDEYLRFEGSGKYWNYQPKNKSYTLNGRQIPLHDGEYLPDRMHNFVVDFITRHKSQPFYMYYAMSHVHEKILPTPDTAPGTRDIFKLYQDNVSYMDKLVGKLIAELERMQLRESTLIVFAGDNGTATPFYQRSTIDGKILSGHKATMLECGALVPCLANWPGKIAPKGITKSLINICDFFPTLGTLAGASMPKGVTIDGRGFAPQLLGESSAWPRDWIFVELGRKWYDRDPEWKLNESKELYDMHEAPFKETLVSPATEDKTAIDERKRLQAVLDELNPAGGYLDPGNGGAKRARKRARKNGQDSGNQPMPNPGNANEPDE
jgi:arylsulfatase A